MVKQKETPDICSGRQLKGVNILNEHSRERTESKDWVGNQRSIYTTLGASNHSDKDRQQHDYYATEPRAMELLLAEEQFSPVIWECACGEGHLSKVLEQALNSVQPGRKVAMFLKLQFLEGKSRKQFFIQNPPKTVYVSSSRLICAMNGEFESYPSNNAICYAWFVWEKGFKGDPIIRWIN